MMKNRAVWAIEESHNPEYDRVLFQSGTKDNKITPSQGHIVDEV